MLLDCIIKCGNRSQLNKWQLYRPIVGSNCWYSLTQKSVPVCLVNCINAVTLTTATGDNNSLNINRPNYNIRAKSCALQHRRHHYMFTKIAFVSRAPVAYYRCAKNMTHPVTFLPLIALSKTGIFINSPQADLGAMGPWRPPTGPQHGMAPFSSEETTSYDVCQTPAKSGIWRLTHKKTFGGRAPPRPVVYPLRVYCTLPDRISRTWQETEEREERQCKREEHGCEGWKGSDGEVRGGGEQLGTEWGGITDLGNEKEKRGRNTTG